MARAYGSIEPEMSHSTTSRRGRSRGARRASRTGSPAVRRAWRSVIRRSGRLPAACGRYRRVRRGGVARARSRIIASSCRSSAADRSAKSRSASRSASEASVRHGMSSPSSCGSGWRPGSPGRASSGTFGRGGVAARAGAGGGTSPRGPGSAAMTAPLQRHGPLQADTEGRGEHPVVNLDLFRAGDQRGEPARVQFLLRPWTHQRHGAREPFTPARIHRDARVVQLDAEPGRDRGDVAGLRERRGVRYGPISGNLVSHAARRGLRGRHGAPSLRPPRTSAPCSASARPRRPTARSPGTRPARWPS